MKKSNIIYLIFLLTLAACSNAELSFSGADDQLTAGEELTLLNYEVTFNSGEIEFHSLQNNLETEVLLNSIRKSELIYNQDQLTSITEYNQDQTIKDSRTYNYDTSGNVISMDEVNVYSALSNNSNYNRVINYNGNVISYEIPQAFFLGEVFQIELTFNADGLIEELKQSNSFTNNTEAIYNFVYDENENCTRVNITRLLGGTTIEQAYNYIYDNRVNPFYTHKKTNYVPLLLLYGQALIIGNDLSVLIRNFGKNNVIRTDSQFIQYTYNSNNYPVEATVRQVGINTVLSTAVFNYQ
ncbi:MAG: hypothetical protein JXR05_05405 [Flavobacteriaceae bacterium]